MAKLNKPLTKEDAKTDLIPEAWYTLAIKPMEEKPTKNGDGSYLQGIAEVVGPSQHGRKVFLRFTVSNPNETAEKIGRRQLAQLAQACGFDNLDDTDKLIGRTVDAKIRIRRGNAGFEDTNEVSQWAPAGSQVGGGSANKAPTPRRSPAADATPDYGEIPF